MAAFRLNCACAEIAERLHCTEGLTEATHAVVGCVRLPKTMIDGSALCYVRTSGFDKHYFKRYS